MIDFRYHVVSIVAVFLAGAIGLVLGTTTLNGVVLRDLNNRVDQLTGDKSALRGQLADTQTRLSRDDRFAAAAEQPLVANRLAARRVVIVEVPGASDALTGRLARDVVAADGTVTAQVKVTSAYVDPARTGDLDAVVTSLAPSTAKDSRTPSQAAAHLLATSLMSRKIGVPSTPPGLDTVLSAFEEAGMVDVRGAARPGDLAIIVSAPGRSPDVSPSPSASVGVETLLDLVSQLDASGDGAVVVGPSEATRAGAVLAAIRSSGIADVVSTVDSAETPRGRVAAIFALAAQATGEVGAYGQAAAGDAPLPKLGP